MLVVDPSSLAKSPAVMLNLPRLRLYDLLGCSVGDLFVVLCLRVPCFASLSALSFPGISQCLGIHWMDVSTSFWLCSLLAVVVVSMSVTIGCLWCCICAMAWIADCESVNMTMLFTYGGLGLSQLLLWCIIFLYFFSSIPDLYALLGFISP